MLLHSGISISSPNTGHKDKLCFSPNTGHKDKLCFSLNTGHILNKGALLSSVHCCVDIFGEDGILIFFHLQVSTYAFRAELYLFDKLEKGKTIQVTITLCLENLTFAMTSTNTTFYSKFGL